MSAKKKPTQHHTPLVPAHDVVLELTTAEYITLSKAVMCIQDNGVQASCAAVLKRARALMTSELAIRMMDDDL